MPDSERKGWPYMLERPQDRIIAALDLRDIDQIRRIRTALQAHVGGFKVGPVALQALSYRELFTMAGCGLDSQRTFLDLKLHDIPNTVEGGTRGAAESHFAFVTVHAAAGAEALQRAVNICRPEGTTVLAITVLSSQTGTELAVTNGLTHEQMMGIFSYPSVYRCEVVSARARMAVLTGCGVVCSGAEEIELVRQEHPTAFIVAPGIRFAGGAAQDQKAVCTPYQAAFAGADMIVMGRELTGASDPAEAAQRAAQEISQALAERGIQSPTPA